MAARYITEEEGESAVGQREKIVQVAGHFARWMHACEQLRIAVREDREISRQKRLLDVACQPQFLTQPFLAQLLGVQRIVPCHWGTFSLLTGTPEALEQLAPSGVTIEKLQPGESVTV